jgi:Holliday junction resolvase RusA-like endonuclease
MNEQTTQCLIISGRLAGRNEAEKAARTHYAVGAKLKRENTEQVAWMARIQHIKPVVGKALVSVKFFEKDEKRDTDNVFAGTKYILDGLVEEGILINDTRRCVDLQIEPIATDRVNPRIEVTITGVLKDGKS